MARRVSPESSYQSGTRSSPAASPNHLSPDHSMPTFPTQLDSNIGLACMENVATIRNQVLIVKDATKDPSEKCLEWALENLIKPGDSVMVLGILHRISNPMGYKSQANLLDFVGTNKAALEAQISQKLVIFEKKFRSLADLCDSRGVNLDITISAGTPLKSVLVKEATRMKVTHVVLDRLLKRDKKYYNEHLQCNVVAFSERNQVEYVRKSSIIYDNPVLTLPRVNSLAARLNFPTSAATSYMLNATSYQSSDSTIYKEDARAATQNIMVGIKDMPLSCLPDVDSTTNGPEDVGDALPAGPEEHFMPSSGSHARENSLVDLFRLSSPNGMTPTCSSADGDEIGQAPVRASLTDEARFKAESILSPPLQLMSSTVADAGHEVASTSHDQPPLEAPQKDIISVQLPQDFPPTELIKAQDSGPPGMTEVRLEDSNALASAKEEKAQLSQNRVPDVAVDDTEEKQMFHKLKNQAGGTDLVFRKHQTQAPPLCSVCKITSIELGRTPRVYDWQELKAATDNFAAENLIAEGGFSFVYKGTLLEGQTVAIKKLKSLSFQGAVQFNTEVEALSCAQHRNLVRLLGYGIGDNERALVYEYVCYGSLDRHLAGHMDGVLEWKSRYKIAIGAARGLRYLHEECRVGCIVHRDMRPNNILITHDFVPMVGDFGLAKLNTNADAPIETQVVGALGFLAPEYVECGQVTSKTDVYSFGVVLLELISGRKAIDLQQPKGEISLITLARQKIQSHQIRDLVDQKVAGSLDMFELNRMVKAASLCIMKDPQARPGMRQVLQILEGDSYDLPIENMREPFTANSSTKADYKGQIPKDFHQSMDQLQMLQNTTKRVSSVPRSRRPWIRTT